MQVTVDTTDDAAAVLERAGPHLRSLPVAHNLVLTLLHQRVARPEAGRYWMAARDGTVLGMAFQSPPSAAALLTPMPGDAVDAVAGAIAGAGADLPAVNAEAATAARFAGRWAELRGLPAVPVMGQRIYELGELVMPSGVPGRTRAATAGDRDLLVSWFRAFVEAVGSGPVAEPEGEVDRRLPAGHFRLREVDGTPCSMAAHSEPVEGVTRIQAVYTPPEHRRCGHAAANVAELVRPLREGGYRCILYTDLGNPTSNGVYRSLGFGPYSEGLIYRFGMP